MSIPVAPARPSGGRTTAATREAPRVPAGAPTPNGRRRTRRSALLTIGFGVTAVSAALIWSAVVGRLRDPDPPPVRGTPTGVVWSDRVFRSEAELAQWLASRGVAYGPWAKTHPRAVAILRARERAVDAQRRSARP